MGTRHLFDTQQHSGHGVGRVDGTVNRAGRKAVTAVPGLTTRSPAAGANLVARAAPGTRSGQNSPPQVEWISAHNTELFTTPWRIVVNLAGRQVTVYPNDRVQRVFPAIVGKPSTPTPTGDYFVEENVHIGPFAAGGPYALATSDRSNLLQEFDGGPGQIALHGLDNLGGLLGTAESHGWIRLADSVVWLAARIGPGVPVTIH